MIILIFIISIILLIISSKYDMLELIDVSIYGYAISVVAFLILIFFYPFNIDAKLEMYTEENQKIEERIKDTVQAYIVNKNIKYIKNH